MAGMTGSAGIPEGVPHGSASTYSNHKCRCDECREAARLRAIEVRARRFAKRVLIEGRLVAAHLPHKSHGTVGAYTNHGCRCDTCTSAMLDHLEQRTQAKKSKSA